MTIKKEKIYMVVLDRMGTLNRRRDVFFLHTVFFFFFFWKLDKRLNMFKMTLVRCS